jgi:hypothetical protein
MYHAISHVGHTREKEGLGSARATFRRRNRACSLLVLVLVLFRKEERVQQGFRSNLVQDVYAASLLFQAQRTTGRGGATVIGQIEACWSGQDRVCVMMKSI